MTACCMSALPHVASLDAAAPLRHAPLTTPLTSAEPASWSLLARDGLGELLQRLASGDRVAWACAAGGVLVSVSLNSPSRRSVGVRSRGRTRRWGSLRFAEPPALRQRCLWSALKSGVRACTLTAGRLYFVLGGGRH
jgi:hypothetical protein